VGASKGGHHISLFACDSGIERRIGLSPRGRQGDLCASAALARRRAAGPERFRGWLRRSFVIRQLPDGDAPYSLLAIRPSASTRDPFQYFNSLLGRQVAKYTQFGFGLDVVVVVLDSIFFVGFTTVVLLSIFFSAGFTTVVLFSVFFSAGGLTVVVFCSHAPKSAALARMEMQISFFISLIGLLVL
jgi:hypothetical protein